MRTLSDDRQLRQEIAAHAATRNELVALKAQLAEQFAAHTNELNRASENEVHLRLLMRELTHRSKNLLAIIQSMARQTARHVGSVERFLDYFNARLQALSRSHDLLIQESWHGVALKDLVCSQLAAYLDPAAKRIVVQGPVVAIKPEAVQSLGLALHELATNAVKHGALSDINGRLNVNWRVTADDQIELVWAEEGGPEIRDTGRRGFGSLAIEHNLARALDAQVDLSFPPQGIHCRIVIPKAQLSSSEPLERSYFPSVEERNGGLPT